MTNGGIRIDMHAHAFADGLAPRAIAALNARVPADLRTPYDGRLSSLVFELKSHGFDKAMLCQIATKPAQFKPILEWSRAVRDGVFGEDAAMMLSPLPSVHPEDPDVHAHIAQVGNEGFLGLKLHPYYQEFVIDSPKMLDYFRAVRDTGMFITVHTGRDSGFPPMDLCGPKRVLNVLEKVTGLRMLVTHFGGWLDWEEADKYLVGTDADLEISMTALQCDDALFRRMIDKHPAEHLFFGSDWPWSNYDKVLPYLEGLGLSGERMRLLMGEAAGKFLDLRG